MEKAILAFQINGNPVSCIPYGHGHINATFKVDTDTNCSYILQKINTNIFKNPVKLMENICAVTEHLRSKSDDPYASLTFLATKDGTYYHADEENGYWRCYEFVPGFGLDTPESDEDFYQSALAFGKFQGLLADFPADTLDETIPEFHNTIDRFRQLKESIAADPKGRVKDVRKEIEFALGCEAMGSTLQKMRVAGLLPLRVTHNDTKLNNVLLNEKTHKSVCVIDLDTVMPGLSAYDYGDSIRFGAATAGENEPDVSKMELDLHLFEVYTRGFLTAAPALTDLEVQMLPMGAFVMTLEVGIRFLKDYIDGDIYFRTTAPDQNKIRCRTQLKLVSDMQQKWYQMNDIVAKLAAEIRG